MTVVAIISEYNPFHTGHEYHIKKVRETFGTDTAVISIMSGNYTQRGEMAFLPKGDRAKMALLGGVDLVLELPFPYSMSSAELFATAGVSIADSIGCVDYLSFGSESGNIKEIEEAADAFSSKEFEEKFANTPTSLGYPERCEMAYRAIVPNGTFTFTSNNILGIEYIKAIKKLNSKILPHTVKREGASYNSKEPQSIKHQSAMAIRNSIIKGNEVEEYLPKYSFDIISQAKENGDLPIDSEKLSAAMISYFRLNPPTENIVFHDAAEGLYNRLYKNSFEASNISALLELSETKNYTRARIRRCMWNSFFGVTSSDVKTLPMYTQVLAINKVDKIKKENILK